MPIGTSERWDAIVGKRPTMHTLLGSKLKVFTCSVSFADGEVYARGGMEIDLTLGKCKEVLGVVQIGGNTPRLIVYDAGAKRMRLYKNGNGTEVENNRALQDIRLNLLVMGV